MKSILSERADGMGFYYSLEPGGYRQINVRHEPLRPSIKGEHWIAYVGGEQVAAKITKDEAEQAAISWAKANPEKGDEG